MDLFIGSLPFKFTEKELLDLFSKYGTVNSAKIVIDKTTRQNKGFGFIEMPTEKEALAALKALNGSEQMGRSIVVSVAQKNKDGVKTLQAPRDWTKKSKREDIITWGKK